MPPEAVIDLTEDTDDSEDDVEDNEDNNENNDISSTQGIYCNNMKTTLKILKSFQ